MAVVRALAHLATNTVVGFVAFLGVFVGYAFSISFLVVAAMKPVFPDNVGIFVRNGILEGIGGRFPLPPGTEVVGGYWVVPLFTILGLVCSVLTTRGAKRFLSWFRARKIKTPVRA
jgi:hypothetical protein